MPEASLLETAQALDADRLGANTPTTFPSLSTEQECRLAALLENHFDSVWRAGRRLALTSAQAEENAQEVFAIAAKKLDRIEEGRERAFLLGVAVRLAANARRRGSTRIEQSSTEISEADPVHTVPTADDLLAQKQQRVVLDEVILSMPTTLGQVLTLYEIEELNLPEIAEALGIPEGTVASRLRRARSEFSRKVQRLAQRFAKAKEAP